MWTFKKYGHIDISPIKQLLDEDDWDNEYTKKRVDEYKEIHQHTKVIPLQWSYDNLSAHQDEAAPWTEYRYKYYDPIPAFFDDLLDMIDPDMGGYPIRIILAMLKGGGVIQTHTDAGPSLQMNARIHIPIITHQDCLFNVGNEWRHIPEGHVYRINNNDNHGVKNNSDIDRVHLIVDYHF